MCMAPVLKLKRTFSLLAGRTYGLEFTNLVAAERLTPVDLLPQAPVSPDGDVKARLLVQNERTNDQRSGAIKA